MTDICPTKDDIVPQALALLPRGRAWQTHDGGPYTGSTLRLFWTAVSAVLEFANRRICDLRAEFWCATRNETDDLWLAEYGLPDACDPFPDLCTKVAALGGNRCEYFAAIAAAAGWAVSCREFEPCGARAGGSYAGFATPGAGNGRAVIALDVDLGASPAFTGAYASPPLAGLMMAGSPLSCEPDVSGLRCILERVIPAHCRLVLNLIPPPTYWMAAFGPTPDLDVHFVDDDGALMLTE